MKHVDNLQLLRYPNNPGLNGWRLCGEPHKSLGGSNDYENMDVDMMDRVLKIFPKGKRAGRKKIPRHVALVLGSGAARGWAHIGVLEELAAAGIKVDLVVGTSMGALVGAAFAAGRLKDLHEMAERLDWRQMIRYFILDITFPRSGLIDGGRVADFVRDHVKFSRIEKLDVPFRAVATNIKDGREFVFEKGDVVDAVRSSIAVPGMFTPVRLDDMILVDGGLVNPVPVSVARKMGADYVVAVDVNYFWNKTVHTGPGLQQPGKRVGDVGAGMSKDLKGVTARMLEEVKTRLSKADNPLGGTILRWLQMDDTPGIFDVLGNSILIMAAQITESRLQHDPPDLLIRPKLGDLSFMDFHRASEIIAAGSEAARLMLR